MAERTDRFQACYAGLQHASEQTSYLLTLVKDANEVGLAGPVKVVLAKREFEVRAEIAERQYQDKANELEVSYSEYIEDLKSNIQESMSHLRELELTLAGVNAARSEQESVLKQLRENVTEKSRANEALSMKVEALERVKTYHEHTIAEMEQQRSRSEGREQFWKEILEKHRTTESQLKERVTNLEKELESSQGVAKNAKTELAAISLQLDHSERENGTLKQKLSGVDSAVYSQLQSLQSKYIEDGSNLSLEIRQLKHQVESLSEVNQTIVGENEQCREELELLKEEVEFKASCISDLTRELNRREAVYRQLASDVFEGSASGSPRLMLQEPATPRSLKASTPRAPVDQFRNETQTESVWKQRCIRLQKDVALLQKKLSQSKQPHTLAAPVYKLATT